MSEPSYLVWSEEHGAWWRSLSTGYTHSIVQAGRYTKAKADEIVYSANKYVHPESGINGDRKFNEVAVLDPMP